jgi:hypothetical protein
MLRDEGPTVARCSNVSSLSSSVYVPNYHPSRKSLRTVLVPCRRALSRSSDNHAPPPSTTLGNASSSSCRRRASLPKIKISPKSGTVDRIIPNCSSDQDARESITGGVLGNLLPSSSLSKRPVMTKAIVSLLLMGAEPHSLEQSHISSPFPAASRFHNGHGPVGRRIQPTKKSESNFMVLAKSAEPGIQSRGLTSHELCCRLSYIVPHLITSDFNIRLRRS